MALDVTVGGEDSNSYLTVLEADAYFLTRLGGSLWADAATTTARKEAVMITATRKINNLGFYGCKISEFQALAFPRYAYQSRSGVWDVDSDGNTIIPVEVGYAELECALWLLKNEGDEAISHDAKRGMNKVSSGKESYDGLSHGAPAIIGPEAVEYLDEFFAMSAELNPDEIRYLRRYRGYRR